MHNAGSQMGEGSASMVMNRPAVGQAMASVPDNNKMMPAVAPGMSQQSSSLNRVLEMGTSSGNDAPLAQQHNTPKHNNYVKIWEGTLGGQRQGQPVFICKLESYRPASSSDMLAADWPTTLQIVRLISEEHLNNKKYDGKADFLVFRALNQHGFLNHIQERKLCAVIQLPTQTLLLSVSDNANHLIGMLFPNCSISLSVISPKQLPKLRDIYNAGKRGARPADPSVDQVKHAQHLVLLSDSFLEARAALNRPISAHLISNSVVGKLDGAPTAPVSVPVPGPAPQNSSSSVGGSSLLNRPLTGGNLPIANVKVEPVTASSSMLTGPGTGFSHHVGPQPMPTLQTSSPSPIQQEMPTINNTNSTMMNNNNTTSNTDPVQDHKPLASNPVSQSIRSGVPGNVNILNNLAVGSAVRSTSLAAGPSSLGLPNMGGTPIAVHMSNMIAGSGTQVGQSAGLGSFNPPTSNMSASLGNSGMGTLMPNVGSQMGQGGGNMATNQSTMGNGIGSAGPGMASGPGNMMPAPGIAQQPGGVNAVGMGNNSSMNIPLTQQQNAQQSLSKYVKIWEGTLSGQRQGQPVFICKLEGYRSASASDTLAADWPSTMQIVRLIAQEHMNNKQYVGKADFLVFRTLNQHGFLGQLQEKKLCAVIQLPSQTLLLSVSDKAGRLIGMLFPGDMVVFKSRASSQPQQSQQIEENYPSQRQQRNALQSDDQLLPSSTAFGSLLKAVSINPPPIQQGKMVDKSRKCKICQDCEHKRRKPN